MSNLSVSILMVVCYNKNLEGLVTLPRYSTCTLYHSAAGALSPKFPVLAPVAQGRPLKLSPWAGVSCVLKIPLDFYA